MQQQTVKVNPEIYKKVLNRISEAGGKIGEFYDISARRELNRIANIESLKNFIAKETEFVELVEACTTVEQLKAVNRLEGGPVKTVYDIGLPLAEMKALITAGSRRHIEKSNERLLILLNL